MNGSGDVERFLYQEAQYLDERAWRSWLNLWDPDGTYWIPQGPPDYDPKERVSLLHESYRGLEIRIQRLESGGAHSQDPPTECLHLVSNIGPVDADERGVLAVDSNLMVLYSRRGRSDVIGGRVRHELRRDGETGLRILHKRVALVGSTEVHGNLTFMF